MTFIISKTLDHGTSNPIVARTLPQWSKLFGFYDISSEQKDALLTVLHDGVMVRLLSCYDIDQEIYLNESEIIEQFSCNGPESQANGRVLHLPHIVGLREKSESYLYNSKSALRDFAGVFNVLFGSSFDACRYDLILKWAEKKFGISSNLTNLLTGDQEWISKIVKMRNAVEHPGGHSGLLHIHNFQFVQQSNSKNALLVPTWHLNDEKPSSISKDMQTNISNILDFTEDVLVVSLDYFKNNFPIIIAEIPETERDPNFPMRLKAVLDPEKVKI